MGKRAGLQILAERVAALERRIADLESKDAPNAVVSTDDVASPPIPADLDTAFGSAATVGTGFVGVVDDAGAGATVWLIVSDGTSWWYEGLTAA
jgi:pyruvate/2-oxoacid:ferredoxin oxidoreductase beta subunit